MSDDLTQEQLRDGGLRATLLHHLTEEYGDQDWVELGSLERIARAVEKRGLSVRIDEELNQPSTARITYRGKVIFDGISRDALTSYRGSQVRDEWGVRYPSGSVEVMKGEAEARRFSFATTQLVPDKPVEVVRKVVTDWEVVPDGGH